MADPGAIVALWLVTWLFHSTLLYGGAALAERWGRLRAPAARETIWRAALLGALLTATVQVAGLVPRAPLQQWFAALARVPAAAPEPAPAPAPAPPIADEPASPSASFRMTISTSSAAADSAPAAEPAAPAEPAVLERWGAALARNWTDALLLVWVAGAAIAAARLLWLARLARAELDGRIPARGALAAEFAALCDERAVRPPPLRVAPALAGPVSLPNGEIAVPPWAAESLDVRRRRALLAHELAHQQRRDPQWQLAALGLQALLWPQPLHALARRRLSALAELQADAWAARAVRDPRAVAECLAECAERLLGRRAPAFGAAMSDDSLLVQRVDHLLEGVPMRATTSWIVRGGVLAALASAACLFPGCDIDSASWGTGVSTRVSISDDGDTSIRVWRPGYELQVDSEGAASFTDDESDVATLAPGGRFRLEETSDGVTHVYTVTANASGALDRSLTRDGAEVPLDAEGRAWLAAALPRMFTESGYDAKARVARLLAAGGPPRVLQEVERTTNDNAKAGYLGELLGSARLDADQLSAALAAAAKIDSDYELHTTLVSAMETQSLDGARFAQLLQAAGQMDSNYDLAEVLVEAARAMPADAAARTAWMAAAETMDSDYDRGRSIEAGLEHSAGDSAFAAELVALAAQHIESDYGLRTLLEKVAPRAAEPGLAAAYLQAARKLESDYERRTALIALLEAVKLDAASLSEVLDATAGLGSDYEKGEVLAELAPRVAGDAALSHRYRDVASSMADYERSQALLALDRASRL